MSAAEVKRKLISKIKKSDDENLLKGFYDLMKDESKKEVLVLTKAQTKVIQRAEEQIAKGNFLTDAQVRKSTSRWLEK